MNTTAITTTMSAAQHQLQHLQVVETLLLLPQLPLQVDCTFSCKCVMTDQFQPVDNAANLSVLHVERMLIRMTASCVVNASWC